jgi:hypothetical protein
MVPFLARVRERLHVAAPTDSLLEARLSRSLAARVAEVRWGADARNDFLLHTSADVLAAVGYFPRLHDMLAGPKH